MQWKNFELINLMRTSLKSTEKIDFFESMYICVFGHPTTIHNIEIIFSECLLSLLYYQLITSFCHDQFDWAVRIKKKITKVSILIIAIRYLLIYFIIKKYTNRTLFSTWNNMYQYKYPRKFSIIHFFPTRIL